MSELQCCNCQHNKTIKFIGVDFEVYAPICAKSGATRDIMSAKPSWCPIDGTGKPYDAEAALKEKDNEIQKLLLNIKEISKDQKCGFCFLVHHEAMKTINEKNCEIRAFSQMLTEKDARIKELEEECERERLRLAACGVAAMSNTERTIENRRLPEDNPYYSASYSDVVRMVEREITQRSDLKEKDEEIRLLKACIFSCLQSDSYEYIKERMELEEKRWEARG